MISNTTEIRVSYANTDKMGYCYYGNYPTFYEIARTELLRKYGLAYKDLEDSGIMMPVLTLNITYLKPAFYDDVLSINVSINNVPTSRITFLYEVFNQKSELLNKGETTLAFINSNSKRPIKCPQIIIEKLNF
jgi:acyl-CoA thioester hydrolase